MDSIERCRGAGDKDAELVDKAICWVEGAIGGKGVSWGRSKVEECGRDTLIDGVLGYVDE